MRLRASSVTRSILGIGLALVMVLLSACGDGGSEEQVDITDFGNRIGFQIPASVDFEAKTYAATGKILEAVGVVPDEYGFLGTTGGEEEPTVGVLSASNGRVFAIPGVDKGQTIAVRFESANGQYFYYLEYQAVK